MKVSDQIAAVLMGDIISSEASNDKMAIHLQFNQVVDIHNEKYQEQLLSPLTITLGDEFQGIVNTLEAAAKIARDIRLELLKFNLDCRFSIGIVKLRTEINPLKAWNMMGEGLAENRSILNKKHDLTYYHFSIISDKIMQLNLDAIGVAITAIERRWTIKQRSYITDLLNGKTTQQIAKFNSIRENNVYKVRDAGEFKQYIFYWRAIFNSLNYIDQNWK